MTTSTLKPTLSVREAIETRRSIRTYQDRAISQKDIHQIIDLVRLTPSAYNLQPWRFHVITDAALKEKLQSVSYGQKQVTSAPAVILLVSDSEEMMRSIPDIVHVGLPKERKEQEIKSLTEIFSQMTVEERSAWALNQTNIALGFMLVALQGLGYASNPMLGFEPEKVKELLGLPEHVTLAAMVPFGYAASEGYPHHRLETEKLVKIHG
ncbi:nitroreductase family protein [Jeotgalibacillus aurantiacus]|uniref:nitroreductase family protein n=1 Tax=Jeotgalibacillus aurantiacus TaxID=2763266 RepID=UPI001D0BE06F|nr:nitroreductase family protein [Jeotgalibacillus aurantiacus]